MYGDAEGNQTNLGACAPTMETEKSHLRLQSILMLIASVLALTGFNMDILKWFVSSRPVRA